MGYGIIADVNISINYGGTVTATSKNGDNTNIDSSYIGAGIIAGGTLTIDGNLTGIYEGVGSNASYGIKAGTINITGSVKSDTVTAKATNSKSTTVYGIRADYMTVKGGIVNVTDSPTAIYAPYLTIEGGTVNASGQKYGMFVNNSLIISDGIVTAHGGEQEGCVGIQVEGYSDGDVLTISGGTVTASATWGYGVRIYADLTISGGDVIFKGGKVAGLRSSGDILLSNVQVRKSLYYDGKDYSPYDSATPASDYLKASDNNTKWFHAYK